MLKHKVTAGLTAAALAALSLTSSAFAAEPATQAVPAKSADCEFTIVHNEDGMKRPASAFKTDEHGNQYWITDDGIRITISKNAVNAGEDSGIIFSIVPAE